jgi:hypothetical protein
MTELNISSNNMTYGSNWGEMSGVIALAAIIKDMGATTSINVESNNIPAEKKEEIYQMVRMNKLNVALSDKLLIELDVGGIGFGVEGAKAVAQYISDNRAVSKLIFNGGVYDEYGNWTEGDVVTLESSMAEANFSNKKLGVSGATIISAWITHKDNGAMTSLNLSTNGLGAEDTKMIVEAIKVISCVVAIILAPLLVQLLLFAIIHHRIWGPCRCCL